MPTPSSQTRLHPGRVVLLVTLFLLLRPLPHAQAASVSLEVPTRDLFVGVPFPFRIIISDVADLDRVEVPTLPDVPGLRVVGGPSAGRNSSTTIIGGRTTTRNTITLTYQLVADEVGRLTIPTFPVSADGDRFDTRRLTLTINQSETGDLLFVDVITSREVYYIGETFPIQLQIWLRPFSPERSNEPVSAQGMWDQLRARASSWGIFADHLNNVRVSDATRMDQEGVERAYYVYQATAEFRPRHVGALSFDDINIIVDYPTNARLIRDLRRSRWVPNASRPIVASPDHAPIEVREPPAEGRPEAFSGAVGRFRFSVTAQPVEAVVGEPITLTMTITDQVGKANLDLLSAPPLHRLPELTADFRVPSDTLAGLVENKTKTFTQSIRATSDAVSVIPPIPFFYFDPVSKTYRTVQSEAIPIVIAPAAAVSVDDVVGGTARTPDQPTELTEFAGGILANHLGPELLISRAPFRFTWFHGLVLVLLPLVHLSLVAVRWRVRRTQIDQSGIRRRAAGRTALKRLNPASDASHADQADTIALALSEYVADRCNLPAGALTRAGVVDRLRAADLSEALVQEVHDILVHCESLRFARTTDSVPRSLTQRATDAIRKLERERIR